MQARSVLQPRRANRTTATRQELAQVQNHRSVIYAGMFRSLFATSRMQRRASQLKLETRVAQTMVAVAARFGYSEQVLQGDVSKRHEPIPVSVVRPSGAVIDKDQLLALIRLRDMLYFREDQ